MNDEYKARAFVAGFSCGWDDWASAEPSPTTGKDDSAHPFDHGYYVGWNRAHIAALHGEDVGEGGWCEYSEDTLRDYLG